MTLTNKQKNIRDYAITGVSLVGGGIAAAFVLAELPALVVAGSAVVLGTSAMKRISKREEL